MTNKRQLIDEIRRYNTTAQPQFLSQFDVAELRLYLDHLELSRSLLLVTAAFTRTTRKLGMVS